MWSSLQKIKRLDLIYRAPSNPLSWSLYEIEGFQLVPEYVFIPEPPEPPDDNLTPYWTYIKDNLPKIQSVINRDGNVEEYTQKIEKYMQSSNDQLKEELMKGVRIKTDALDVVRTVLEKPFTKEFFAEQEDPPFVKTIKAALNNNLKINCTVTSPQYDHFSKPEFLNTNEEVHAQYRFTIPLDV